MVNSAGSCHSRCSLRGQKQDTHESTVPFFSMEDNFRWAKIIHSLLPCLKNVFIWGEQEDFKVPAVPLVLTGLTNLSWQHIHLPQVMPSYQLGVSEGNMTENLGFSPPLQFTQVTMLKAAMSSLADVSISPHTGAAPNFHATVHHSGMKDKALPTREVQPKRCAPVDAQCLRHTHSCKELPCAPAPLQVRTLQRHLSCTCVLRFKPLVNTRCDMYLFPWHNRGYLLPLQL